MTDDLVKLLRRPYGNPTFGEKKAIADRIEKLEVENARLWDALEVYANKLEEHEIQCPVLSGKLKGESKE